MSAAPHDDFEPDSYQPLSALENAMRRALECYSREQVLDRVVRVLPTTRADDLESPEPGLHGKVQKVSVSLPSELTEAIRARVGAGGFSRYVAEAVQERIRLELLDELLAEFEAEYGPIDEAGVLEAMKEWPDYESQ
jgi:hypothetical protein